MSSYGLLFPYSDLLLKYGVMEIGNHARLEMV
jgi:hypothetical protein